ncbi:MAG: family 43 glycosylhydrolase [Arachidicoccus sp.]|nr:family 43 glycosylhydrolase [Arachidicoccus sp.]
MKKTKSVLLCMLFSIFILPLTAQQKTDIYDGYLFAYFDGAVEAGQQEQLRFAVSKDAQNWSALNNNHPIISADTISSTGGIRDPHILRGEKNDGFYMVATDMFTMKNGWGSNPGIVLMHSDNLIDWNHSYIDLAQLYPKEFGNVKWVWAPQTIFDPKANKYLIYFTIRFKDNDKLDFYSAYANKNFSGFESKPKLMFSPKYGGIDGDIIYKDGTYHFFFKGNTKNATGKEIKNGIQQAVSKSLKGPWQEDFKYLDSYAGTPTAVEGSSVFKLNNSNEYMLMYDLYADQRYEFQTSKDLYNFSTQPQAFTKNFNPRHGSIISITKKEARLLEAKWGGVPVSLLKPTETGDIYSFTSKGNPIITHEFTADPAALVKDDTMWLFSGHDFDGNKNTYKMKDWQVYSSTDLKHWSEYPVPLKISDFSWAKNGDAYAGQVIERDGKFYWYVSTNLYGIGVAVADRPEGPYKDALGKPLLTNKDCFASKHSWACIDPTVFIDDNGQAWLFWGNGECYYAKLKKNMTEIEGDIKQIKFTGFDFTEAPWIHKYNGIYYLSYASGLPEKTEYAMSKNIEGPYEYKGILNEIAGNSNTNHQAIVEFNGQWYFIYHNGSIQPDGGSFNRSICIEYLQYNADGTIKRIQMSTEGVDDEYVPYDNRNNPVIKGYYADPEILYSNKTGKYYIYPTSDGFQNWSGNYFKAFSSYNLKDWKDEGIILDVRKDVSWAHQRAWAPAIIEKKIGVKYKYYFYFVAEQNIGVGVADNPTGPFKDSGKPLIPAEKHYGQAIDPDVFQDPVSGKYYLYWGNSYMKVAELNDNLESIKSETVKLLTPDKTYNEGTYVFYRNGKYYFMWSENDTRSEDYCVRYGFSQSPTGPIVVPEKNLILSKDEDKGIYGTGHNSVIQIPGKDEWYIVYHRFRRPNAVKMGNAAGYHREVCIDHLEFNNDGTIKPVVPTL